MSDLDLVIGRKPRLQEMTSTGDIAPVMTGGGANMRAKRRNFFADRKKENARRRAVAGVLGATVESAEEEEYEETTEKRDGVIPKDAEELEGGRTDPSGLNIKTPEFKKRDPDSPKDDQEVLMSPKTALVAPDVTPDSMTEINPSEVPGGEGKIFRSADAVSEPQASALPAGPRQDTFTSTMDTLLGRQRNAAPMESKQSVVSEAEAAAVFSFPVAGLSGDDLLRQNQPMPDPTVGDGKKVFESFRRFI